MTCHGTCSDYADEMDDNEKKREERRKEQQAKEALNSPAFDRMLRESLMKKKK
jgi:hypothetical protein